VILKVEPYPATIEEDVYVLMRIDIVENVVKELCLGRESDKHKLLDKKEEHSLLDSQMDLIYKRTNNG
jgi:hypothetical protein